ncbi:NAD(P)H-hydrate dehydratase [Faecalimonas sp.]
MRYVITGKQMKYADHYTIEEMKVPSCVLMERAALKVVEILENEKIDCSNTLIVCGSGNNGGDGLAIARLLHLKGMHVDICYIGNKENASEENKLQYTIAENYGISIRTSISPKEYSVIIDALLGIGLKREITGKYLEVIEQLNLMNGTKVAIDIPTGVCDTTGNIKGCAFNADITVCFAFEKIGMLFGKGRFCVGKTYIVDIGIMPESLPDESKLYTYDKDDTAISIPKRELNGNKGTFGKVLIIAGSKGMAGAAYFNAKAAYLAGAGLVQIYTHEDNRMILQQLLPEAIVSTYETFDKKELKSLIDWSDVLLIGSGLGKSELSEKIFIYTMHYAKVPRVIDGDGLTLLSENLSVLVDGKQVILTPHLKEMSRLLQCTVNEIQENRVETIKKFVASYPVVCAMKDARTLVAGGDKDIYVNTTGNQSMAKAGAGDILAGIIVGFLAQRMDCRKACETAVYVHGLCGDYAKDEMGSYSVLANDLLDKIGYVMKKLEKE